MLIELAKIIKEDNDEITSILRRLREYLEGLYDSNPFKKSNIVKTSDLVSTIDWDKVFYKNESKRFSKLSKFDNYAVSNKFHNFDVILEKTNKSIKENPMFSLTRTFLNSNIGSLIKSGPNILSNMYDVYFTIESEDNEYPDSAFLILSRKIDENNLKNLNKDIKKVDLKESTIGQKVINSLTEDAYSLSVRTASISIPQRRITVSSIPFEGTDVNIPESNWSIDNEATLNLTLDANLYIYEIFNSFAGLLRRGTGIDGSNKIDNNVKVRSPNGLRENPVKVNLYVSSHSLSGFSNLEFDSFAGTGSNILFEFEDIKFLGIQEDIGFSNDSSKGKSVNAPFIFKNINTLYKVDSSSNPNGDSKGISYNKDFNKYLDGESFSSSLRRI